MEISKILISRYGEENYNELTFEKWSSEIEKEAQEMSENLISAFRECTITFGMQSAALRMAAEALLRFYIEKKRPKLTYRTIRRDCAKRNRR